MTKQEAQQIADTVTELRNEAIAFPRLVDNQLNPERIALLDAAYLLLKEASRIICKQYPTLCAMYRLDEYTALSWFLAR